ncbi:MAG: cob(I)yrinic acid a,c-diamide adenosyltransferase [Lachnospiraceae bacterium]|nr:cob(I)yrinic acid a,c-diamide adenosyltransferase [Lachnospiraceae bacterium]
MINVFTGEGHGKSPAAIGEALQRAAAGDRVVIIQFLKGKGVIESEMISRLEPELKIFRFEKTDVKFDDLPDSRKEEETINIRNGINFAKKVISTGGCDLLVLDEILGIADNGIISIEELEEILKTAPEHMDIILTGITLDDRILAISDHVSSITARK